MPTLPFLPNQPLAPAAPDVQPVGMPPEPGPLAGVDPEVIRRLAATHGLSDREAAALLRFRRAAAMMGKPPEGRQVREGIYVAASPMEHLASAVRTGTSEQEMRQAEAERRAIGRARVLGGEAAYRLYGAAPLTDPDAATGY